MGEESNIRKGLAKAAGRLLAIKENRVPEGRTIQTNLNNLFIEIDVSGRWGKIVSTLKKWGIKVD